MTIAEACLFGLGIADPPVTVPKIRFELGGDYTSAQIKGGLATLAARKPPMAEVAVRAGPGTGTRRCGGSPPPGGRGSTPSAAPTAMNRPGCRAAWAGPRIGPGTKRQRFHR